MPWVVHVIVPRGMELTAQERACWLVIPVAIVEEKEFYHG